MDIERRTRQNTVFVLIDYVSGFANIIGSQTIPENVSGGRALVQTARTFGVPLVVTTGPEDDPRGVLYPEIAAVLGDHPVVHRGLSFDAFDWPPFEQAVARSGARHLVVAGLTTDGCVTHTILSALRRDYGVSLVVDASACEHEAAQAAAIHRLGQHGVTMRSWMSLASELQGSYDNTGTLPGYREIQANMPGYAMLNATIGHSREAVGATGS